MTRTILPALAAKLQARFTVATRDRERGDAVGWVLIAVMTAGLIAAIWVWLGSDLQAMVQNAINKAKGSQP